jgi:hypothetical protein
MTDEPQASALVAGELRGYRQFHLRTDGLYPLVHSDTGPWDGDLERARCAVGSGHPAPGRTCRCGLYAWYLPGSATVSLGPASAVVAARGRRARSARRMLASQYPRTRVYRSARRMLKDFPPHDVRALGIEPPQDRSRGYRTAAIGLGVTAVLAAYSLAFLPREAVAGTISRWWPLLVLLVVAWQAGLVWLISRLLALQTTTPERFAAPGAEPLDCDGVGNTP